MGKWTYRDGTGGARVIWSPGLRVRSWRGHHSSHMLTHPSPRSACVRARHAGPLLATTLILADFPPRLLTHPFSAPALGPHPCGGVGIRPGIEDVVLAEWRSQPGARL